MQSYSHGISRNNRGYLAVPNSFLNLMWLIVRVFSQGLNLITFLRKKNKKQKQKKQTKNENKNQNENT